MEEQKEQQEVQSSSDGQLTSYIVLPFTGISEGLDILVEHSPEVSPWVEQAVTRGRSQESQ